MKIVHLSLLILAGLLSGFVSTTHAQEKSMKNETTFQQIFPQGEKLPEQFSKYFIGQAYLAPLTQNKALNVPASNVTLGDYQTRTGLDARQREMLTFSMLVSLGGCESQVKGHIRGNDDGRRYYRRWWISVAQGVSE